ncbi:hypothetical protein [Streptobacillus moniliformis]|uniref:hypothetical protein n=1 Tax=Streptobacillus moniliformis TaxID=34105 RepID=UPI0007E418D5|nr:hypothetical protein [Streptobacillus moniliformis]
MEKIKLFEFDNVSEELRKIEKNKKEEIKILKIFRIIIKTFEFTILFLPILFAFFKEIVIAETLVMYVLFPFIIYLIYICEEITEKIDEMIEKI